jgi:transposase-like protein
MIGELTTSQAAERLGVHPVTLRKWRKRSEHTGEFDVYEDCQGLQWWYKHDRKIMYCEGSVNKLKRLLVRRSLK